MNQLKVISFDGKLVTDSREVAEMVGKSHDQLMRSIRTYISYLDSAKMQSENFFIDSSYKNSQNKIMPCYLLTKKGCDMVANKMTGSKGVQFTAEYVTRFEQMEQKLQQPFNLPTTYKEALLQLVEKVDENEKLQLENKELKPKASYYDLVLQNKSLLAISTIAKDYGLSGTALNKILHELGIQYKQGGTWLLYQKYAPKGYAHSRTQDYDGGTKSKLHTYWTQKGRMFIYQILKEKKGILPIIERENEQLRLVD
ncbi:phage antirepressor KilAC domain-containing protein [Virgibacillus salexigens]|uniref:phage antirepressor KilAC domain-containing protein n=1 Tax=Virgibacillus salexigens TaxID=61016 RepID=UPI00190B6D6C|nr:phage antirepressor KilAC domain-containing protein [Virgibacillus salexigens]